MRRAPRLALAILLPLAQPPVRAGAQAALPAATAARIDSLFARYARRGVPGCAVGVVRAGALVHAKGYGVANVEYGIPLSPHSAFYVASLAKQFTAAAVALLVEEGKLTYDADVRALLPELPPYMAGVTVRHLLHHTSGVRDYLVLFNLAGQPADGPFTEADVVAALRRQRGLGFPPGERHSYSNSGYVLLGMIVRRASGTSLRRFADARLFAPLGMTQTRFLDDHTEPVVERAVGYAPYLEPGATTVRVPITPAGWRISVPNSDLVGDGGLFTSVEDLARWEGALDRGAVRDSGFASRLAAPGRLRDGTPVAYGMGLALGELHGLRRVGHGGAFGGYRAELLRVPERRLSVIVLCNTALAEASHLAQQAAEVVLGDSLPGGAAGVPQAAGRTRGGLPRLAVPVSAEVLAGWTGIYHDPRTGALRAVTLEEDGRLLYARGPGLTMLPRSAREFDVAGTTTQISFVAPPGGAPVRMTVIEEDEEKTYERLPGTPAPPDRLADFVGVYDGEDLGVALEVGLHPGTTPYLTLRLASGVTIPLVAGPDDLFLAADYAALRFERDRPRGRVTGLLLDAERANGLRFVRR